MNHSENSRGCSLIGRWWWLTVVLSIALCLGSRRLHAGELDEELPSVGETNVLDEVGETKAQDMLSLSLRLDAGFSAGAPDVQGFSIPSLRFSAFGDVSDSLSYRVSFGQTREFSSIQLPQILPVEAYLNLRVSKNSDTRGAPAINWRIGMFTPTFNPWWSPDLTDLELPDYDVTHKTLFLSRDIGTELSYEFNPNGLKVGVGAFNGNGIFSLNSNNSKAFTAFANQGLTLAGVKMNIGAASYALFQSTQGSINFKSDWVTDVYASLNIESLGTDLMIDGFGGTFQDSIASARVGGFGVTSIVGIARAMKVFARWESLDHSPSSELELALHHFELGPIFLVDAALKVYAFYEFLDFGDGTSENAFQVRLRLVI